MRQVNMNSLEDDARETLTIAGLEKAREQSLEQHSRLRAPQTWAVFCNSVDQSLRTTVDSITVQHTPHVKSKCRLRNLKCSHCGKTGHLKKMRRRREKSSGKTSSESSGFQGSRKGKNHCKNETCCCGQPGRRPACPHRNEKCLCGERPLRQFYQSTRGFSC